MSSIFHHTFPFIPPDLFFLWRKLHPGKAKGFFFGSGEAAPGNPSVFMSAGPPVRRFHSSPSGSRRLLEALQSKNQSPLPFPYPRFVGFLSYESGRSFDSGLNRFSYKPHKLPLPGAEFFEFENVLAFDLTQGTTSLLSAGSPEETRKLVALLSSFGNQKTSPGKIPGGRDGKLKKISSKNFEKQVLTAKRLIKEGEIYQANLSVRFEEKLAASPFEFYERLCRRNPSPYACFLPAGAGWLASSSPELLLSLQGRSLSTRPIAGTRPRGRTKTKDRGLKGNLLLSPKERAEHIMLVDLERNDLGRVCENGSVHVSDRFAVEGYSHVMHIVSQVQGRLKKDCSWVDAVAAVFPGGTITGCPKIRAVEVISSLEPVGRGPFYGSAGYLAWNGDVKFNILIRTSFLHNKRAFLQAGAGIVADSRPKKEFEEVLAKAAALRHSLRDF